MRLINTLILMAATSAVSAEVPLSYQIGNIGAGNPDPVFSSTSYCLYFTGLSSSFELSDGSCVVENFFCGVDVTTRTNV